MKKLAAVLSCLMVLSFLITLAHAVEPSVDQEVADQEILLNSKDGNKLSNASNLNAVVLSNEGWGSSFILKQNLEACLKKCDSQYESCIGSAGDDPTGQFRCGEERFMCTRGCDNQFYSQFKF